MLSSSSRLLRVLSLLQTRSHWAGPELAERLAVHPRTLRRDIDRLRQLGYPTPQSGELDQATRNVLAAFQMKYRPARHDGEPDAESAAILQVLNQSS